MGELVHLLLALLLLFAFSGTGWFQGPKEVVHKAADCVSGEPVQRPKAK